MSRNQTATAPTAEVQDAPVQASENHTEPVAYPNATPQSERKGAEATLDLSDVFDFQDGGSPYALIKSVNRTLKTLGSEKELPTQMGYAYTKNGAIDGVKHPKTTGVRFSRKQGLEWAAKYISKQLAK